MPVFPHLKESPPRTGFVEDRQYDAAGRGRGRVVAPRDSRCWRTPSASGAASCSALRVRQVDLLAGTIHLEAGSTKNDDGRAVKMTREVWELLAQCVQNKEPDDHVFTRSANDPVLGLPRRLGQPYDRGRVAWTPLP